jgi:hypothetical protein
MSLLGLFKTVFLPLFIIFLALVIVVAASKRDSRYYHWLSKAISPVSRMLLPQSYPVHEPGLTEKNFQAGELDQSWQWFQPELLSTAMTEQGLVMTSRSESLWWKNSRGPMVYRYVEGDGHFSIDVKTRKASDSSAYPDTEWQFGGIMLRDPSADAWFGRENYVFAVIGHRYQSLQLEIKSTVQGVSDVAGFDWPSGDASVMIERRGPLFTLKARPIGSSDWRVMGEFNRPDLPSQLQLGIIAYTHSEGRAVYDFSAVFSDLAIKPSQ